MRFYNILFSLFLLVLAACHRDSVPDSLIGEEKMIPLLIDIHLADGYLSVGPQVPDSLSYRANGLYAAIFKKYQVDSGKFKKSFQYYSVHLEQMNNIYKAVSDRLKAKQDSITKRNAAEEVKLSKKRTDSLAKISKIDSAKKDAVKRVQKLKPKK